MRAHNLDAEELLVNSQSIAPTIGRNKFINGNFDIWQRGSGPWTGNNDFSADRWSQEVVGESLSTAPQTFTPGQTDVPGNPRNFIRYTVTSSGSDSGDYVWVGQKIEDVYTFAGDTVTLSFYAKVGSGTPDIAITTSQYCGSGGSGTFGSYKDTITLSTTWTKYTSTFSVPSISGKTIGANSYLYIEFWLSAGSTWDAFTGSLGFQSITLDLAQVQIEAGSIATEFEHRFYGEELLNCFRYYQKFTNPAYFLSGLTGCQTMYVPGKLLARVRRTPDFTLPASTDVAWSSIGANITPDTFAIYNNGYDNFYVHLVVSGGTILGGLTPIVIEVDAEL